MDEIAPTPAPWRKAFDYAGLVVVTGVRYGREVTVAVCDGPDAEPNAALIVCAPLLMQAVLDGNVAAGLSALSRAGLA